MNIQVTGLVKQYGRQKALAGVSLELRSGGVSVLLGHNGAGKSTLIGILSTLVRPTAGKISWNPAPALPRAEIGVVAHEAMVYGELTAEENLHFWGALHDVADLGRRSSALLDEVGLDDRARKRTARTFSRGMLQRLALARALLADPRVLLFDEPFTGLDRDGAATLSRVLRREKERGRLILVATHDLEAVAGICDHLVVLLNGKVVLDELSAGAFSLAELKSRYEAAA
jgi:heme exporter protein A